MRQLLRGRGRVRDPLPDATPAKDSPDSRDPHGAARSGCGFTGRFNCNHDPVPQRPGNSHIYWNYACHLVTDVEFCATIHTSTRG